MANETVSPSLELVDSIIRQCGGTISYHEFKEGDKIGSIITLNMKMVLTSSERLTTPPDSESVASQSILNILERSDHSDGKSVELGQARSVGILNEPSI